MLNSETVAFHLDTYEQGYSPDPSLQFGSGVQTSPFVRVAIDLHACALLGFCSEVFITTVLYRLVRCVILCHGISDDNTSDMVTMHRSTAHEENVSMSIMMIHKLRQAQWATVYVHAIHYTE